MGDLGLCVTCLTYADREKAAVALCDGTGYCKTHAVEAAQRLDDFPPT